MNNNLLLGNGVNIDFGILELSNQNIFYRFQDILIKSSPLYECVFGKGFDLQTCKKIFADANNPEKLGIESLARNVYDYLKNESDWSDNDERELIDFITVSSVNAIFFNGNHLIDTSVITQNNNITKIPVLQSYSNVFSLNYAEFWDTSDTCTFLHGKHTLPQILPTKKNILLYQPYSDITGVYNSIIDDLSIDFYMVGYSPDVVFSPLLDKQDTLYVGHCPSPTLFPGPNTFPAKVDELYTELDNIKELDVFGMSPFGDNRIIEKISKIPNLTIYVYNLDPAQVNKWSSLLGRNCCTDSSMFYDR